MRRANVFVSGRLAGRLEELSSRDYVFAYSNDYFADSDAPAVSLTLPKTKMEYRSDHLFPFFFNMLSEGHNRDMQCRLLHIDKRDSFGLLLATAMRDTPGAVTVEAIND